MSISKRQTGSIKLKPNSLERVPIHLVAGSIFTQFDQVIFRATEGNLQCSLPVRAENYVRRMMDGIDLETLIVEMQSRGQSIDYRLLKNIVIGLYSSGCIKNRDDIRGFLDSWNQPPLEEPMIIYPFARNHASTTETSQGIEVFAAAAAVFAAGVLLATNRIDLGLSAFMKAVLALLLMPSTVLSGLAFVQTIVGIPLGYTKFRLGARFSPLGIHFDADSRLFRSRPLHMFIVSVLYSVLFTHFAPKFLGSSTHDAVWNNWINSTTRDCGLLVLALTLLPGLYTPLGHARLGLRQIQRKSLLPLVASILLMLSTLGVVVSLAFSFQNITQLLVALGHVRELTSPIHLFRLFATAVFAVWGACLVRDTFAGLDALAEDFGGIDQVRNFIQDTWRNITQMRSERERARLNDEFGKHSLFQMLSPELRKELVSTAKVLRIKRGSRLIRQDSRSTELFLLLRGSVGVYKRASNRQMQLQILTLEAGSIFGESGFFLDEKRTADVIAMQDCKIIVIKRPPRMSKAEVQAALVGDTFRKKIWASQALASSRLFKNLPSEAILHILNFSEVVSVDEGCEVMREGESADSLWICVQGECAISVKGVPRPSIGKGEILGEIALIWNTYRTATVTTTKESIFLKLSAPAFRRLLSRNLFFASNIQMVGEERLAADREAA